MALHADGRLTIWDLGGVEKQSIAPRASPTTVTAAHILTDGTRLALCKNERQIEIVSWPDLKPLSQPVALAGPVATFDCCLESQTIAVITKDGALNVYGWDGRHRWGVPRAGASSLAHISQDSARRRLIVTTQGLGGNGGTVVVFGLDEGANQTPAWSFDFDPVTHALDRVSGRLAVIGGAVGQEQPVAVWEAGEKQPSLVVDGSFRQETVLRILSDPLGLSLGSESIRSSFGTPIGAYFWVHLRLALRRDSPSTRKSAWCSHGRTTEHLP
jgi:hypothetical protein